MSHPPSLSELVAKYVDAIAQAKEGKGYLPVWATDLSLYKGRFKLWFEPPMQFWSNYIAEQTLRGALSPFWKREVIRYVPLRDPQWRNVSSAKEYWLQTRLGMHWLLVSGAVNIVTFGDLDSNILATLNFALVPDLVLIESHDLFEENYQTLVRTGRHGELSLLRDFMDSRLPRTNQESVDPSGQEIFPIYYQLDSFKAVRQSHSYFRHVLARFNWRLQSGMCPDCGVGSRYRFEDMQLDHLIPVKRGGNNTLLNLEMRCSGHNLEKSKRLSETRDYVPVAAAIMNRQDLPPRLRPLFSLTEEPIAFPVRFHFVPL